MNGDLSIVPPPAAVDLTPSARPAPAGPARPAARPSPHHPRISADRAAESAPASDAGQTEEATRLKNLLTDPAMRVSMQPDEASGRVVLRVQSRASGEVIEQIPSEELLHLYAALRESLVDEHA